MAPMRTTRRLFALVAAFAVALGALWPLVSAARPTSVAIPSFICTQSGFQHPDVPGERLRPTGRPRAEGPQGRLVRPDERLVVPLQLVQVPPLADFRGRVAEG